MRKTAREAPRRSAANRNVQEAQVTIRMYKVGFGDCFLLLIPTDAGTKKMLIDCGSLKNHKKKIAEISNRVIEDIRDSDGTPRIDVLVVTHRHADHISGFANPEWSKVEVGEVWIITDRRAGDQTSGSPDTPCGAAPSIVAAHASGCRPFGGDTERFVKRWRPRCYSSRLSRQPNAAISAQ